MKARSVSYWVVIALGLAGIQACSATDDAAPEPTAGEISPAAGKSPRGKTCPAGFGDCDGTRKNGCETSLTTTTSCGTCGATCDANATCATSASGQPACVCNAGYAGDGATCTPSSTDTTRETGDVCVQHYNPNISICTANDFQVAAHVTQLRDPCGEDGIAVVDLDVAVSTSGFLTHYDLGLFLALDGGSALSASSCLHAHLPQLPDGDGDVCGNLESSDPQTLVHLTNVAVACRDADENGTVEADFCASWANDGATTACSGLTDAFPKMASNCSCRSGVALTGFPAQ